MADRLRALNCCLLRANVEDKVGVWQVLATAKAYQRIDVDTSILGP